MAQDSTGDPTEYPKNENTADSGSPGYVEKITSGLKAVFDTDLYKSLPPLALIGFVLIGFSGNLNFFTAIEYICFLLFLVILHNGLYLIKAKPFELWNKFQHGRDILGSRTKRFLYYRWVLAIFFTLFACLKLYFIALEQQFLPFLIFK